ncbi:MAG: CRISPR-associated helicase Cas3' [Mobilitalea sp.]
MIAHINSITGEEQSVVDHCRETAKIAGAFGETIHLENTLYILGILHDFGKSTKKFEDYIKKAVADKNSVKRGEVNHSSAGAIFITERYYKGDEMHKLTAQLIAEAIFSHHGLYDIMSPGGKDIFNIKIQKKNEIMYEEAEGHFREFDLPLEELDPLFEKAVDEIREVFETCHNMVRLYTDGKEINIAMHFYISCLQRTLLSVLIDADRLDTAIFCGNRELDGNKDRYKNLWEELHNTLEEELKKFTKTDKISLLRGEISEECFEFARKNGSVYKLMVPTGGGKTLASLRYALAHAKQYDKDRIIYVAPYMSILDQNADVIKKILHREDVILEHYSNVINELNEEEELNIWKQLTENWDSPLILTTMVQMLNTLFDGRTQCIRRMHNLSNSIIIFDEIQSIPAKCIHIFNLTVNFLSRICGATVILCSATQPLLDRQAQYKVLLGEPSCIVQDVDQLYEKFKRVQVIDKTILERYDAEKLSDFMMEIMETSDNVLTIMNTKKAVENLFTAVNTKIEERFLTNEIRLVLLTTHMCPSHRLNILNEIRSKLGKEKIICISTSLIEAGVDISFECVIRSLSGLDNIAQAAGRCNRNGQNKMGKVFIINSCEEDLSKLPEIKTAQNVTNQILNKYKSDPEYFSNDLLSPSALEKYYEKYYKEIQGEMNYRIKELNTNLLDLLSLNETGMKAYYTDMQVYPPMILHQAYKTAGDQFEVIVNHTYSLIVPYDSAAREFIAILEGNYNFDEVKQALRKIQVYTVNIYSYELEQLLKSGGVKVLKNADIYVLVEGFYSTETGVTMNANIDFLSI